MKKILRDVFKFIIISFVLEIFVFNINSFRSLIIKDSRIEYNKNNIQFIEKKDGKAIYKINNINNQVKTIKIKISNLSENNYEYQYAYSDETTSGYFWLPKKIYIESIEKSKYLSCYLSGKVNGIQLIIDEDVYQNDLLEKIIINERIPVQFKFNRFLFVFGILSIIFYIKESKVLSEKYSIKNLKQEIILLSVTCFFILIIAYINICANSDNSDNMYNKGLVDSLLNGKVYLLNDPSEKLLNLNDPYDPIERNNVERDIDFIWDSALYNGHQYVYFGIFPVIFLFLPYFCVTGTYLKTEYVVFLFSIFAIILLKEIFIKLIDRFFKEIPFKIVLCSLIVLLSGSLVIFINGTPRFYEVAIISGLYCVLQGLFFILKSIDKNEIQYKYIFLGSLFLALSVACRPTDLLASIIIIPLLLKIFFDNIKELKNNPMPFIKFILSIIIPYASIGVGLMYYNYIRFDNIFEFGAKYQLTVNNMGKLGSRIYTIPIGIICNLFSIPKIIPNFPFLINHNNILNFNGYYYVEDMIGGLFILAPVCFFNFYLYKICKLIKNNELKIILKVLNYTAVIILILSIVMAGSTQRYLLDYAWMFVLSGILIFINIYSFFKTEEAKKILMKIFYIIACYTFIINVFSGIVSEKQFVMRNSPEKYYNLKYDICFWE